MSKIAGINSAGRPYIERVLRNHLAALPDDNSPASVVARDYLIRMSILQDPRTGDEKE